MGEIKRNETTTTLSYEPGKPISEWPAPDVTTFSYSSPLATKDNETMGCDEAEIRPSGDEGAWQERLETLPSRTLEFRLAGSEEQRQCAVVPANAVNALFAAATRVRAYVTHDRAATAARITGVDVEVGIVNGQIVCIVRPTDLTNEDLVVVKVDVVVSPIGD